MPEPVLYRAERRSGLQAGVPISRRDGRRLPSNVPFVVDNLWEYTRPDGMPSRRHSVYASPAPELALAGASQGETSRTAYQVCRVELKGRPRVMQISVADARTHPDVAAVQEAILRTLRLGDWAAAPLSHKLALAPLFLPGVTREELSAAAARDALLADVLTAGVAAVTIWTAAPCRACGEIFFELGDTDAFVLVPLAEEGSAVCDAA